MAYRSSATAAINSGTSLVINKPAGTAENDVLVVAIAVDDTTISLPSGWNNVSSSPQIADFGSDNTRSLYVATKVATSSEPSNYTFTLGVSQEAAGGIAAYEGYDPTVNQANGNNATGSGTTISTNSITPSVNGCTIISVFGTDATNATAPTDWSISGGLASQRFIEDDTSTFMTVALFDEVQATAAAISRTGTVETTTSRMAVIIALAPEAGDTDAPTIEEVDPADEATDVSINTAVEVRFDDVMDDATVTSATFNLRPTGGSALTGTITPSLGDVVFTLTPDDPLEYETEYTIRVTTGVEDLAGNALAAQEEFTFTTEDAPSINAVRIEIAFTSEDVFTFDDADLGFDDGLFDGSPVWTDVTQYVRSATIKRGMNDFQGIYARANAGTATIVLDNSDARFDPTNDASPYAGYIFPMVQFRVRVERADGDIYLWRGYADSWDLEYPELNHDATCTLTGTDGIKVLTAFNGTAQTLQGSGELSGARINRILDNAGWHPDMRVIDTGGITMQSTNLAQNAWSELTLTSDSEVGELYIDGEGKVIFRDVFAIFTETRSTTPQAVFGDDPSELGFTDVELVYDDSQIANLVRISKSGGSQQTAEDGESQVRYQVQTYERSDLVYTSDAYSQSIADFVLFIMKDAQLRFTNLEVNPLNDPVSLFPQVWERDFGDRITVRFSPKGREDVVERDCYIRGITHTWTPNATWITRWVLQDTAKFDAWAEQEEI